MAGQLAVVAVGSSCGGKPSANSIGPQGGILTSEDDALTIVLWPGALGSYEDFSITPSEMTPDSYGQPYRVQPNVDLAVDAEIILRGDLPNDLSKARIGAIDSDDFADGDVKWTALPHRSGAVDNKDGTVHSNDDQIALYYAMLDDGLDSDASSSSESGTSDTMDTSTTDPTGVPVTTSYATNIQAMIFNVGCLMPTMCHGDAPSGGLSLAGNAYDLLVDVPSTINGQPRVIPGDPDGSLLYQKLARTPPADGGMPMPPGATLPADALALVRLWIEEGCPP